MSGQILYKRGETTRNVVQVLLSGAPLNLSGKTLKVKLATGSDGPAAVTLTVGSGLTVVAAGDGKFAWDVSAANLATLGDPDQVWTVWDVWNADLTLAATGAGFVPVAL